LPAESLPMTLNGFPQPGLGFGLGVSVRLNTKSSKPDPAAGEYGWSGAASTSFWVAPRTEFGRHHPATNPTVQLRSAVGAQTGYLCGNRGLNQVLGKHQNCQYREHP
jgi:hypothetical protein